MEPDHIHAAKLSLIEHIQTLNTEAMRLTNVLKALQEFDEARHGLKPEDAPAAKAKATTIKKRGRRLQASSPEDVAAVVGIVKEAGKEGVNAIRLARLVEGAGLRRVSKGELLATDRVRTRGQRGGTTYFFAG